jgi:hypothetical protein
MPAPSIGNGRRKAKVRVVADDAGRCKDGRGRSLCVCVNTVYWRNMSLSCFVPLRLDLQPMNRETVPMSEILVSDELEKGWVTKK